MLPSLVAREIKNTIRNSLVAKFEASDPCFNGLIQHFLEKESHWTKGPFIQIGLPFKEGTQGKAFFDEFEIPFSGHAHQEAAWQRLSTKRLASSTLIATGTGSGKTECFLYPLLDHCAREKIQGVSGIKALVIYPMNALAHDQARRFAEVIAKTPIFDGLRVGLFVGGHLGKEGYGQMIMSPTGVITDRETLRRDPPDILLTNYKMLDYLLIRPKDQKLWAKNHEKTLRYLVVDELHTFDGAQGTDLALLLRRLQARLKTPPNYLICVGTSATLGENTDTAVLCDYAKGIFGIDFQPEDVVSESQITQIEFLSDSYIEHIFYPMPDLETILDAEQYSSQKAAIAAWFPLFFPKLPKPTDVENKGWRIELGQFLKRHLLFVHLVKSAKSPIVSLQEIREQMRGILPREGCLHVDKVLDALLALVAWARNLNHQPLVTLRVHLWLRELRRMVARVSSVRQNIELFADSDIRRESEKLFLPLIQCTDCHTTGWLSRLRSGQSKLSDDLNEIYSAWFSKDPEVLRLYQSAALSQEHCHGISQYLCSQCGHLQSSSKSCTACGGSDLVNVFKVTAKHNKTTKTGSSFVWHDPTCPTCGNQFRQLLLGARSTTIGSLIIDQSWASPFNEDKKLIVFSDSVQDAAHRAGFFMSRTYVNTVRRGLAKLIDQVAKPHVAWTTFLDRIHELEFEENPLSAMSESRFVSEFIAPNMMWQPDWAENLQKQNALPEGSRLPKRVKKRLEWEAFAEFTYLSLRRGSLENIGQATLAPRVEEISKVADVILPELREEFGIRHLTHATVLQWLWGLLCHMRQQGAVMHPEMHQYVKDGNIFSFMKSARRKEWLPSMGPKSPHPIFLSLGKTKNCDYLVNQHRRTFYQIWLASTFGKNGCMPLKADQSIYEHAIDELVKNLILLCFDTPEGKVVGLNPEKLILETSVAKLVSRHSKRELLIPEDATEALIDMPCLDSPQEMYSQSVDPSNWFLKQLQRGNLRRIFCAEHTGLLKREQREALELRFKAEDHEPWHENLLSATPTLEMGVDIGDLSSVMLCSVPPNQASYLQRIGRAGRKDGNAFVTALADGRSSHDLYFFENPKDMLLGQVMPPGIFLKAAEVLRRQMFAFCLDDWVSSGIVDSAFPDKTKDALDARDNLDQSKFPYTFLEYMRTHQVRLLTAFKSLLGDNLDNQLLKRLNGFMRGTEEDDALGISLNKLLEELAKERKTYRDRRDEAKKIIKKLRSKPQDAATKDEINDLEREHQKAIELTKEINERVLLNTLTDGGLIPNYAFPESGIELKSVLWRQKSSDEHLKHAYLSLTVERYERPAQSALSEFAPGNIFYANQRKVKINQVNLNLSKPETWRMCQSCQHMENLEIHNDKRDSCPICGDSMWSDASQKHQLLRFKQAIANSNDTEARIDDSTEKREHKYYVCQMLADFDKKDIREAYQLKEKDIPFGFEFIERVIFRDINFGESTKSSKFYWVGGEQRSRPGFKLCKYCGHILSTNHRQDEDPTRSHTFNCEKRNNNDPKTIFESFYLYREFTSEALRILVPYTKSGVDQISVQSFIAAMELGLKAKFGGKVDHIHVIQQTEKNQNDGVDRHYIMLYDSVPGGTGYLHQLLAKNAETLIEVFELALECLSDCSCNAHPEKDGCYRCLYQYRLRRAMPSVSRDRAKNILEHLMGSIHQIERITSIAKIHINPNFGSELEARFIESLRQLSGKNGLPLIRLIQDIVHGKSGYLIQISEQRYWIEPQVDLKATDGVSVASRPDFIFWPIHSQSHRRPIAVFCDGWAYHQSSMRMRDDALKRSALVASGKYYVWSITWEEVELAMDGMIESKLVNGLETMYFNAESDCSTPLQAMFNKSFWSCHAIALLIQWLGDQADQVSDPFVNKMARHAGTIAFRMIPHPQKLELEPARNQLKAFFNEINDWALDVPTHSVPCGNVSPAFLKIRYAWPSELANPSSEIPVSPGFVILVNNRLMDEEERHLAWRQWLWLFNVFQALPGFFMATQDGIESADYAPLTVITRTRPETSSQGAVEASSWDLVIKQAMSSLRSGLEHLKEAHLPDPDEVGFELEKNGQVVAEAELAWVQKKLVLLMPKQEYEVWIADEWEVLVAHGEWEKQVASRLQSLDN